MKNAPDVSQASAESLVGPWVALFPATYLAHIAEEYFAGFASRTTELTGLAVPEAAFLAANALFWVLMCGAVLLALRRPSRAPIVVALATIVTINGVLHVGAAALSAGYTPGLLTGVLLWLPLGLVVLVRCHRILPRSGFRSGVVMGVVAHLIVPVVGLIFVLAFGGSWRAA